MSGPNIVCCYPRSPYLRMLSAVFTQCSEAKIGIPTSKSWFARFGILPISLHNRTKFRSQTFDKMDRWKSRGGKSQRRERKKEEDQRKETKKREDQRRETEKKEDSGAQKGRKVAKHCVFPRCGDSAGEKIGSVKGRVQSHLAG